MKNSMNVKIAMLVAASEYARLTLAVASSSPMSLRTHLLQLVAERDSHATFQNARTGTCPVCRALSGMANIRFEHQSQLLFFHQRWPGFSCRTTATSDALFPHTVRLWGANSLHT